MKIMKIMSIRVLLGLILPWHIAALLHGSHNSLSQDPSIACGKGSDKLTAYQKAYLEAYYKEASKNLFHDSDVSSLFRKLDLNGNGVLDCAELDMITKELDLDKREDGVLVRAQDLVKQSSKREAVQMLHSGEKIERDEKQQDLAKHPAVAKHSVGMLRSGDEKDKKKSRKKVIKKKKHRKVEPCTPKCTWKCSTRTCDQLCAPKCKPPQCQTRCSGMNTNGCKMECGKPRCTVVCPPKPCAKKGCPICKTQCGKPMCKLNCPPGAQDCRDVCETPSCSWQCKKPMACPRPACEMKCDSPKSCSGSSYKEMPGIKKDEVIVQSFETPLSLQQQLAAPGGGPVPENPLTVPVAVTQAVEVPGTSELKLVHSTIRVPVVM